MAREDRIARLASEDEATIRNSPPEPKPLHLLYQDVDPAIMPPSQETSPIALHVDHYYPTPHRDTASHPQSRMFPYATMFPVPEDPSYDSPFLAPPNKVSHCSKFKTDLESSFELKNDTLLSLETLLMESRLLWMWQRVCAVRFIRMQNGRLTTC
jgi:hypothetical protein